MVLYFNSDGKTVVMPLGSHPGHLVALVYGHPRYGMDSKLVLADEDGTSSFSVPSPDTGKVDILLTSYK